MLQHRLPSCQFCSDTELKKKGRGTFEEKETTIDGTTVRAVKWYDNRGVILASTFAKSHLVGTVQKWDRTKNQKVEIDNPSLSKNATRLWVVLIPWMLTWHIIEYTFDPKNII